MAIWIGVFMTIAVGSTFAASFVIIVFFTIETSNSTGLALKFVFYRLDWQRDRPEPVPSPLMIP